jgi:hypothetical protein
MKFKDAKNLGCGGEASEFTELNDLKVINHFRDIIKSEL